MTDSFNPPASLIGRCRTRPQPRLFPVGSRGPRQPTLTVERRSGHGPLGSGETASHCTAGPAPPPETRRSVRCFTRGHCALLSAMESFSLKPSAPGVSGLHTLTLAGEKEAVHKLGLGPARKRTGFVADRGHAVPN